MGMGNSKNWTELRWALHWIRAGGRGAGGNRDGGWKDEGTAFGRKAGKLGMVIFHC